MVAGYVYDIITKGKIIEEIEPENVRLYKAEHSYKVLLEVPLVSSIKQEEYVVSINENCFICVDSWFFDSWDDDYNYVYYTFRNNALRRFKIQQELNKIKQVADTTELEKWMNI